MVSFTAESTIHGVTFIFGPNRPLYVRIFWSLLFILSIYGLFYYIHGSYTKWQTSPDILTKTKTRNSTEFPHPAITICPMIIGRSDLTNLTEILAKQNQTFDNLGQYYFRELSEIIPDWNNESCVTAYHRTFFCKKMDASLLVDTLSCSQKNFTQLISNKTLFEFLDERSLSWDEIKDHSSRWKSLADTYSQRIKKVLVSPYGVCYSINLYSKEIFDAEKFTDLSDFYDKNDPSIEWSNDREYFDGKSDTNPTRFEDDIRVGTLTFAFNKSDVENNCANGTMQVIVHPANEIPTMFHSSAEIRFHHLEHLSINMESVRMSLDLKRVGATYRRCYFEDEQKLKYFRKYSETHCKLECLKEFLGCRMADFPAEKSSRNFICRSQDVLDALVDFAYLKHFSKCNCMPNCNFLNYTLKEERAIKTDFPEVHFWVRSPFVEQTEKFSTYLLSNFISDIGGYLGLFLGCSMLSIVEIIFFAWAKLARGFQFLMRKGNSVAEKEINIEEKVENLQKIYQGIEIELRMTQEAFNTMNRRMQRLEKRFKVNDEIETIYLT